MNDIKFIKLNDNDNYLSFGNFFRVVKEELNNPSSFVQSDLFSILFDTYDIADSTVNNYCTGLRSINNQYKNYFNDLKTKYEKNNSIFIPLFEKLIGFIEGAETSNLTITKINKNTHLMHICNKLYSISKNDSDVSIKLSNDLLNYLEKEDLYSFIINVLYYVILEKKQPILIKNQVNEVIEKNIYNTNISVKDIQEFIKIQLNSGIWSIRGITQLANLNNPFACFELASLEYYGLISGKPRYDKAYEYYKIAADNNHPVANWAIGYLYYQGQIGTKSKHDMYLALKYFNKAKRLNCSNAYNSIGIILKSKDFPHVKPNNENAKNYFEKAISLGNIYAYSNIGKIFEENKQYDSAYNYYLVAANSGDSWAQNKIGEYYRKGIYVKKDLEKAFEYYKLSSESDQFTLCYWSKYNLAKYFYLNGIPELKIQKNNDLAIELLDDVSNYLIEACEELIYIYYDKYIFSKRNKKKYLEQLNYYKTKCELSINYNSTIKKRIEKNLIKLNNTNKINIP